MRKIVLAFSLFSAPLLAQLPAPGPSPVTSAPSGSCKAGARDQIVVSTGDHWFCGGISAGAGTWAKMTGGAGSAPGGAHFNLQFNNGSGGFGGDNNINTDGSGNLSAKNGAQTAGLLSVQPLSTDNIQYLSNEGNDANNGRSWGSAKATLGAALSACTGTSTQPGLIYISPNYSATVNDVKITSSNSFCHIYGNGADLVVASAATAGLEIDGTFPSAITQNLFISDLFITCPTDVSGQIGLYINGNSFGALQQSEFNNVSVNGSCDKPIVGTGSERDRWYNLRILNFGNPSGVAINMTSNDDVFSGVSVAGTGTSAFGFQEFGAGNSITVACDFTASECVNDQGGQNTYNIQLVATPLGSIQSNSVAIVSATSASTPSAIVFGNLHSVWSTYIAGSLATGPGWNKLTLDSDIEVTRIDFTAQGTAVNCTVAPQVTVTDGTHASTLNLANGYSSTGTFTQTYSAGTTLQINTTAGTCTTEPSSFLVNMQYVPAP